MSFLSQTQIEHFRRQGYLVVESLIDAGRIVDPILADYDARLDDLAETLHATGHLSSSWSELAFGPRVMRIYEETNDLFAQNFNISVPPRAGVPADTPICLEQSIFNALFNPDLLDAIEGLIGPEIAVNPIQHVRIKPPQRLITGDAASERLHGKVGIRSGNGLISQTPWHQDNCVVTSDADNTNMLTVWFPLTEASIEMGCLKVLPGSHEFDLLPHCRSPITGELMILPEAIDQDRVVTLPMQPGDVLFLHRRTCHSSLPNLSDRVRFSLDLRYQPTEQPSGRAMLPNFVARSRTSPSSELNDIEVWRGRWKSGIAELSAAKELPPSNRWTGDTALCA
jgi:phytanoyl-CoA hydroxylase